MRPIYPQSGYTEADLTNLLATRQFSYAECFTITPKVGDPLRYTSWQRDVSVVPIDAGPGRVTYDSGKVLIKGLRSKTSIGVEVDQQDVTLAYPDDATLYHGYLPFSTALLQGLLDGAVIRRDRYFCESPGSPWIAGTPMFRGRVSTLNKVGRQSASMSVKSSMILLDPLVPRDLWQPLCKNTWGDSVGCDLNQGDFVVHTTLGASPSRTVLPWASVTAEYELGKVYIESSDNVTRIRTIRKVNVGVSLELIIPLDFDPIAGQDVSYYPNCRRERSRCGLYFINPEEKFLGFPLVPVAETSA